MPLNNFPSNSDSIDIDAKFLTLIESGQITKIKLVGDSITVGVQGGGGADPSGTLIGTTGIREALKAPRVWANYFREFINSKYPSIEFFNAGIGGYAVTDALSLGTGWYGTNNDVVFLMLGTNDRGTATEDIFETNFETLCHNIKNTCNYLYVMSAPPAESDFDASGNNNAGKILTMEQIDKITTKVCVRNGYKHISFYREFLNYQAITQIPVSVILNPADSHPLAPGYLLMWKTFQQKIGLITNYYDWKTNIIDTAKMRSMSEIASYTDILNSTLPQSFPANQVSYDYISTVHPGKANYPEGASGSLVTIRGVNDNFIMQLYYISGKGNCYARWGNANNTWTAWFGYNDMISASFDSTYSITQYPANKTAYAVYSNANPDAVNMPEGAGGAVITFRPSNDTYACQEYRVINNDNVYKRHWTGSTWSLWKRTSGNMSLTTVQRTALSTVGLSKGDSVFDETLGKPVWRNTANNGWVDATGAVV